MEHSGQERDTPHQVLAEQVKSLRRRRDLSAEELAEEVTKLGIPWTRAVVAKLETGRRPGVNIAELFALAIALDVSPVRLVLPAEPSDEPVQVTPNVSATWEAAWRWATGDQPLLEAGEQLRLDDKRVRRYVEDNRPYERRPVDEAALLLAKREHAPFTARIRHDGTKVGGTLTYGGKDDDGER